MEATRLQTPHLQMASTLPGGGGLALQIPFRMQPAQNRPFCVVSDCWTVAYGKNLQERGLGAYEVLLALASIAGRPEL